MPKIGPRIVADYLLPNLNAGTFGEQLEWVAKGEKIFRMAYKHKNNSSWTVHDAALFVEWDRLKDPNRHRPDQQEYYTLARQRMNSAINKLVTVGVLQRVVIGPTDSKEFKYFKVICEKKPPKVRKKPECQDNTSSQENQNQNQNQCHARTMYIYPLHTPGKTNTIETNDQSNATGNPCPTLKTSPVNSNGQCNASTQCTTYRTSQKKSSSHCLPDPNTQCTAIKKTFHVKSDNQDQFLQVQFLVSPTVMCMPNGNSNVSNKIWEYETETILKSNKCVDINQSIQRTAKVTFPVEKLFWCRLCEKTFKVKSSLNRHHRKVHSEPLLTEENCKNDVIKTELPVQNQRLLVTVPLRIDILHDIISDLF